MDFSGWKIFAFIVVFALMPQCKQEEKPEGLLNKEQMVSLMVDVYMAEVKVTSSHLPRDSVLKLFYPYEDTLAAKRGLNDSTLKANYQYYLQRPGELEVILDAVIDTLNLREQRMQNQP